MVGATITLTDLNDKKQYLSSDMHGLVQLKKEHYKGSPQLAIQISYIGYETLLDSISITDKERTIVLIPKENRIQDVVVTAQYSPTSIEKSINKVNVISSQKIEDMAAINIRDVLSNELNIRLSEDNILGSRVSMQGMGGQNVKFLIEGVPIIGRMDGQIDLSQINLNDVERIEIIEGPLSVNYGSNALAGTINIISKTKTNEKLNLGIGSYSENIGTFNFEGKAAFKIAKNHNMQLNIGRNYFDGWSPEDDFLPTFKPHVADSSRAKQWNARTQNFGKLQYYYSFKELLFSYKGELFQEVISNLGLPRRTSNSYIAFDDFYTTKRLNNALFVEGKLSENYRLNAIVAYNDFERRKEARRKDLVSLKSTLIPKTAANDIQDTSYFDLLTSRASLSSLRGSSWINYEIGYDFNLEHAEGERIEGGKQEIGDYAAFASTEIKIMEDFLLKPGVRYSYNTKYNAPLTPSINLKYAKANSIFRLSFAKGFRAPTLKELYFNFNDINHSLFGNADLKAEQSNNYSASIQQKFLINELLFKTEVVGFYNQIYNQISFAQSNEAMGDTLIYFNIGENKTKGANLNISLIHNNLRLNIGGSYIGIYNQLATENPVDKYAYSTEIKGSATYLFKKPQLTLSVFGKHQGSLPAYAYNSSNEVVKYTVESYQIVDLTLGKKFLQESLKIAVGCKNLLDITNIKSNVNTGAHSNGSSGSVPMATGRMIFLKIEYHLNLK